MLNIGLRKRGRRCNMTVIRTELGDITAKHYADAIVKTDS